MFLMSVVDHARTHTLTHTHTHSLTHTHKPTHQGGTRQHYDCLLLPIPGFLITAARSVDCSSKISSFVSFISPLERLNWSCRFLESVISLVGSSKNFQSSEVIKWGFPAGYRPVTGYRSRWWRRMNGMERRRLRVRSTDHPDQFGTRAGGYERSLGSSSNSHRRTARYCWYYL